MPDENLTESLVRQHLRDHAGEARCTACLARELDLQPGSALLRIDVRPEAGRSFPQWTEAATYGEMTLQRSLSNYPNPFNPSTIVRYSLPAKAFVTVTLYDILGREVKQLVNSLQEAGLYDIEWDGTNREGHPAASGLYFCRMTALTSTGQFSQTRKMLLVR